MAAGGSGRIPPSYFSTREGPVGSESSIESDSINLNNNPPPRPLPGPIVNNIHGDYVINGGIHVNAGQGCQVTVNRPNERQPPYLNHIELRNQGIQLNLLFLFHILL